MSSPYPMVSVLGILIDLTTIAGMLGLQYLPRDPAARLRESFGRLGPMLQGAVLALGLFVITTLGAQGVTPFIYFRF